MKKIIAKIFIGVVLSFAFATNLKGLRLTGHQFYSGHHVEDWYF